MTMHDLSPCFLLMIEPQKPCTGPHNDSLTKVAEKVYAETKPSEYAYRGAHYCVCGERSDSYDHLFPDGTNTNSLMVHYIRDHREEVPLSEKRKLVDLGRQLGIIAPYDSLKETDHA